MFCTMKDNFEISLFSILRHKLKNGYQQTTKKNEDDKEKEEEQPLLKHTYYK